VEADNRVLNELENFDRPPPGAKIIPGNPVLKPQVKKISYTHDAMIDQMIANPSISGDGLAAMFGYTPAWISTVRSSDNFKARLAERRKELIDPVIIERLEVQFEGVVRRSMEILQEKLSAPAKDVSDNLVLRALDVGTKALGYGAGQQAAVNVQINVDTHLEKLGGNLVKLLAKRKEEAASGSNQLPVAMEDDGND
jgi:hypothetical protein